MAGHLPWNSLENTQGQGHRGREPTVIATYMVFRRAPHACQAEVIKGLQPGRQLMCESALELRGGNPA